MWCLYHQSINARDSSTCVPRGSHMLNLLDCQDGKLTGSIRGRTSGHAHNIVLILCASKCSIWLSRDGSHFMSSCSATKGCGVSQSFNSASRNNYSDILYNNLARCQDRSGLRVRWSVLCGHSAVSNHTRLQACCRTEHQPRGMLPSGQHCKVSCRQQLVQCCAQAAH